MTGRKGFVTFFLNITENNKDIGMEKYIALVRKENQASIDALAKEGYVCIFLPVFDEACRVEKVDILQDEEEEEEKGE